MGIKVNSKDIPAGSTEATEPQQVIPSCQSIHAAERTTELASQEHIYGVQPFIQERSGKVEVDGGVQDQNPIRYSMQKTPRTEGILHG